MQDSSAALTAVLQCRHGPSGEVARGDPRVDDALLGCYFGGVNSRRMRHGLEAGVWRGPFL